MKLSIADFAGVVNQLASFAAIALIFEVSLIIILFAALAIGLALLARWLQQKLIKPIQAAAPATHTLSSKIDRISGKIIDVVVEFHSRRAQVAAITNIILNYLLPADDAQNNTSGSTKKP